MKRREFIAARAALSLAPVKKVFSPEIPKYWFDSEKCADGFSQLAKYKYGKLAVAG